MFLRSFVFLAIATSAITSAIAQNSTLTLRSVAGLPVATAASPQHLPALSQIEATTHIHFTEADPTHRGELFLEVSAQAVSAQTVSAPTDNSSAPFDLTLRVPLSSTEDAYGESRTCSVSNGHRHLVYTAGLDERNFLRFAPNPIELSVRLLLNKYLCRALAAPFHCEGREVHLPAEWSRWSLGQHASLSLSTDAPATLLASPLLLAATASPFDPATCAIIAPSNGFCCVSHKTTEWHCGGSPIGAGWHQVSGECFHRETGGSCTN